MESPSTYALSSWLFLRLLAIVYCIAFVSLAVQVRGLIGTHGIMPASALRVAGLGASLRAYLRLPTLCRWTASDRSLQAQCWGGAALSVTLLLGFAPIPVLLALWLLYVSLTNACGIFLGYQWDALLAEMGLLAVLLAPPTIWAWAPAFDPPAAARLLLIWLLFRLVFSSGVVKLRSGDPTWHRLSALRYHYETQPLPNRPAWYAHQLPMAVHRLSASAMFAIELGAPILVLGGPPYSYLGVGAIVALMVLIEATGNYCFFNIQTIALCVLVFPDTMFAAWTLDRIDEPGPLWYAIATVMAAILWALSLAPVVRLFVRDEPPRPIGKVLRALVPFRLLNSYGLFAVMTTSRPEIIVEGTSSS